MADAAPMPALAGTTVVRASRPAAIDVRLPRAATVATPLLDSPDLSVVGAGRVTAFALVGTDRATAETRLLGGVDRAGTRFLFRAGRFDSGSYGGVGTFPRSVSLPAGAYRLYVVPDGAPVTITLTLHGLSGRTTVVPATPAGAAVIVADGLTTPAPQTAYTGTVTHGLDRPGILVHFLRGRFEAQATWYVALCQGPAKVPRATAACPDGSSHTLAGERWLETTPRDRLFVQGFGWMVPGTRNLSGSFAGAVSATDLEYVTVWLTL